MFVVHRVDDDLSAFLESSVRADNGHSSSLNIDVATGQVFYAFKGLPFWTNQSLSTLRKSFHVAHKSLIDINNDQVEILTFDFHDFDRIFVVKTFYSMLIRNASRKELKFTMDCGK